LALLSIAVPLRGEGSLVHKVLRQVLCNEATFGQDEFLLLGRVRGVRKGDADDRRLAQGVNLFELNGGLHVGIALKDFDVVLKAKLFQ